MSKIKVDSLTPQQESKFSEYVDKFIKLGLSTRRLDDETKAEVISVIGRIYQAGNLDAPKKILFFPNPNEMVEFAKRCGDTSVSNNFSYGSFDANWLAFYAFFRNECPEVEGVEIIQPLIDLVGLCSYWLPYKDVALVSQNPIYIHKNDRGLHNMDGPALAFENEEGFTKYEPLYYMNGLEMPKWIIETPKEKINAKKVLAIKNVDQRREALRKLGPDLMFKKLKAKELDLIILTEENKSKFGLSSLRKEDMSYGLYELDFGDGMFVRYLKMDNPSIDAEHIEGVPNECQTVEDALAFRNQKALEALGIRNFSGKNWVPPTQLT